MRMDHREAKLDWTRRLAAIGVVGGMTVACLPAFGQNALGDGRGLEANTRQGSGGRNFQRPSLADQVQFRNAISTGNAPGGLSFRGDLGYQAPGEFTGALGSDSLYSFRRDSLYSGLAGMGIRGTDAIQYQFAMTTGAQMTRNLVGNGFVSRFGGSSSASLPGGFGGAGEAVAIDPLGQLRQSTRAVSGTLRSTSSYSSTSGLVPELVSVYESGIERDKFGLVATPLMGLVSTPMQTERIQRSDARAAVKVTTSYADTIKEIQARAQAIRDREQEASDGLSDEEREAENNDWIAQKLATLQRRVLGIPDPVEVEDPNDPSGATGLADGAETGADPTADPSADPSGIADPVKIVDPMNPDMTLERRPEEERTSEFGIEQRAGLTQGALYEIDPETLEVIRGDGNRVTYFVDPGASDRDPFAEHLRAGERLLKAGRYFDAEERFTLALSMKRGNVTAQLGRLHAQIGAGLVLSASMNLQGLMTEHMEIVSRRYSGDLLPDERRIRELIGILRERGGLDARPSYVPLENVEVRVSCGLLIAYLGYQIGDKEQMNAGFGLVRRNGTDPDVRLVRLLEAVWGAVLSHPPEHSLESESVDDGLDP